MGTAERPSQGQSSNLLRAAGEAGSQSRAAISSSMMKRLYGFFDRMVPENIYNWPALSAG